MARRAKRLLALLLALMLCVSLLPATALAEEEDEEAGTIALAEEPEAPTEEPTLDVPAEEPALDVPPDTAEAPAALAPTGDETQDVYSGQCGDDLTWSFDEGTGVLTITGTGDMWPWDQGGAPWYKYYTTIATVELPDGVTSIGEFAFYWCSSLTSVTLPESVTSIGDSAFWGCSGLTSVTLPASVINIGSSAFYNCSLLKTAGPLDGDYNIRFGWTESIPDYAFHYCSSLTSVTLPEGVTSIGERAFYECSSLTSVILPDGVTSIGNDAFCYCSSLTSVTLPESVTSIGNWAFSYCTSLTSVTLPESVTNIGSSAFYNCSLLKTAGPLDGDYNIRFGWTESIPDYAFAGCSSLTSVEIPASLTSIGEYSFNNCSNLSEVYYGGYEKAAERYKENGWDTWGNDALFNATWYYGKTLEDGWDLCGNDLIWHYDTATRTITIKGSGPMWDFSSDDQPWKDYAGKLVGVNFESGITTIGGYAFNNCDRLRTVEIPAGVTIIGDYAFNNCSSLTSVEIPASVTSIGYEAFSSCSSLTSVTIPAGVTGIGEGAFYNCSLLKTAGPMDGDYNIRFGWTESIPDYAFAGCSSLTSVTLPEGVTSIGESAFWGCSSLTSVTIPAGVTSIGESAFYWCSSLTSVTLPDGATSIGDYAFCGCSSLTSVTLPESLISIGRSAFYNCSSLTSVNIPEGITSIGDSTFYNCSSLTSVTLPEGVTSIGNSAFYNCSSLMSVTLTESLTSIGNSAFYNCSSLTSVTVPDGVTSIGNSAFYNCSSLTSVTVPDGVTSIGDATFYNCSNLTSVTLPDGVTSIGNSAFYNCSNLKNIVFLGGAPDISGSSFTGVTANAYYPDDGSWWEDDLRDYGGKLIWIPYTGEPMINVFGDVQYGKYYYAPVLWAYYHEPQITGGTSDTSFSPNKTCTREQIVTFLWKACGAPEPETTANPFTDVKESKYYFKAVLWAVEKGITGGMSADKFGVGKPCTREQAMTFLWKACDSPEPESADNPFTDVKEGKYYYDAVLWAVEKGITGGVGNGLFGVGKTCTRGQIVTFLYAARTILGA